MSSTSVISFFIIFGCITWLLAVSSLLDFKEQIKYNLQKIFIVAVLYDDPVNKVWSSLQLLGEFWVVVGCFLIAVHVFGDFAATTFVVIFLIGFWLPIILMPVLLMQEDRKK
jgi:hypothetical protein